ncbi:MAG: hypothetical protein U5K76_12610 [Woeseiaceae bacterium]|nr:hypothetical protein [Woeseiaceae bacterium]
MHRRAEFLSRATLAMTLPVIAAAGIAATAAGPAACPADGRFAVELYGTLEASLAWHGATLDCQGMPRPHGAGARLRFAGPGGDDGPRLAFILALPDLVEGRTARELPATLTLIEEDGGRFFSNRADDTCWADVESQEPLPGGERRYAIAGIAYCLAPLTELNGDGRVSIRALRYAGHVDWKRPE